MKSNNETNIEKNATAKKLVVTRKFNAPVNLVWRAWTEAQLLDQWWAPKPWKAVTKTLDFKDGGHWLYAMKGPKGEISWCIVDFSDIEPNHTFTGSSSFCDENGVRNNDMPAMKMVNLFEAADDATLVNIDVLFETEADLNKIVEMGFKEGFTMAHGNLDELLETETK